MSNRISKYLIDSLKSLPEDDKEEFLEYFSQEQDLMSGLAGLINTDETEYLTKSPINKQRLLEAINELKERDMSIKQNI